MLGFDALGKLALGELPSGVASALTADAGAFVFTGQDAALAVSMPDDAGAYTLAGQSVGFVVSMPADAGSLTLSGQAALLPSQLTLACDPFYAPEDTQFGLDALGAVALGQLYIDSEATSSFEISSVDVVFSHTMAFDAGAIVWTGNAAALIEGNILSPQSGDFAVAFQPFATGVTATLETGAFAVTGPGTFDLVRRVPKLRRFPRTGTTTIAARSMAAGVRARAYGG